MTTTKGCGVSPLSKRAFELIEVHIQKILYAETTKGKWKARSKVNPPEMVRTGAIKKALQTLDKEYLSKLELEKDIDKIAKKHKGAMFPYSEGEKDIEADKLFDKLKQLIKK